MNKTCKTLLILLLALNITTIITIVVKKKEYKKSEMEISFNHKKHRHSIKKYFMDSVGFDNTQMKFFNTESKAFHKQSKHLIYKMDSIKKEMFNEINKTEPNLLILNSLSDSIGEYHSDLKKASNTFYLKIKSICNNEQQKQLKRYFLHFYKDRNIYKMKRHKGKHKKCYK